uniref:Protein kinase domain-containing protein n=1 Tax=Ascaris lumbricoides TaxID=6252 RepID=A0A0M3HJM8_ASCLU
LQSDVWSYGVLLWEIFTLGDDPFKEFETAQKLTSFYESGGRLTKPPYMPENMSVIMSQCWLEDPNDRATFSRCKKMTEGVLREMNPQVTFMTITVKQTTGHFVFYSPP